MAVVGSIRNYALIRSRNNSSRIELMDLGTVFLSFLIFIYMNYFIENVVGVSTSHQAQTHPAYLNPNAPIDEKVRRQISALHDLMNKWFKRIRYENEADRRKKYTLRIEHENEMKSIFTDTQEYHFVFKDYLPNCVWMAEDRRYVYLDQGYYATLYDTYLKIPVYSAYTLRWHRKRTSGRVKAWKLNSGLSMKDQPAVTDYNGIQDLKLHRGHLYPQYYAEDRDRKTYTNLLTNIALQYGSFNMNTWKRLEYALYKASKQYCRSKGDKTYLLTGVLPSSPYERKHYNNINIPDYFWTAVCCDKSKAFNSKERSNGWSFAYIVKNENEKSLDINMFFVQDFLKEHGLYAFIQLFKNDGEVKECLYNRSKTASIIKHIKNGNRKDTFHMKGELSNYF